jgi:putative transposase
VWGGNYLKPRCKTPFFQVGDVAAFFCLAFPVEPLSSFRKLEKKLAREQRNLARKVKGSANWKKQKARITRTHIKIADARNDFLHKHSTTISQNHAVVVLEDLQIANMSKSAKGDMENPGRNTEASWYKGRTYC